MTEWITGTILFMLWGSLLVGAIGLAMRAQRERDKERKQRKDAEAQLEVIEEYANLAQQRMIELDSEIEKRNLFQMMIRLANQREDQKKNLPIAFGDVIFNKDPHDKIMEKQTEPGFREPLDPNNTQVSDPIGMTEQEWFKNLQKGDEDDKK